MGDGPDFATLRLVKPSCRPSVIRPSLVLPALVALALGSLTAPAAEVVERILVRVNSRIITQSSLDARVEQTAREGGTPESPRGEELRRSVMEELVNESLLEDRAHDGRVIPQHPHHGPRVPCVRRIPRPLVVAVGPGDRLVEHGEHLLGPGRAVRLVQLEEAPVDFGRDVFL